MGRRATPVEDRVYAKIEVTPLGCWNFTGAINPGGYGRIERAGGLGTGYAHRVTYEDWYGPIPEGMTIDHLCANPACVYPNHLEVVTRAENTRRVWRAGRIPRREQSHCKRGHPLSGPNIYTWKNHRHCLKCRRIAQTQREMVVEHGD